MQNQSIGYQFSIEQKHQNHDAMGPKSGGQKVELPKFESSQILNVVKQVDKWMSEHVDNYAKLPDGIGTYENKIVWQLKDGRYVVVKSDLEAKKPSQWIEEVPIYSPYKTPPKTTYEMSSQRNTFLDL